MNVEDRPAATARRRSDADLVDGLVTLGAAALTFLAFDDITTDHSASFAVEYACLALCAAWGAILVGRLAWRGRTGLAGVSAGLLVALLWGQRAIGPGLRATWTPEYVVATSALLGTLLVAGCLLTRGRACTPAALPR